MKFKKFIIIVLSLLLLLDIALVILNKIYPVDNFIYNAVTSNMNDTLTSIIKAITNLGGTTVIISICLIILLIYKNKIICFEIIIFSLSSSIVNNIFKMIMRRPRPDGLKLIKQGGYSFPSGHAMASVSLYGLLIYFIYISNINKKLKILLITLLSILILAIGFSRIYLGVHFASDIFAGYLISILLIIGYTNLIKNVENK